MRALVMMLVLLAALGAGGYFYSQSNPNAFAPKSTLAPPAPPPPRAAKAEDCPAERARYEFANDTRFTLHFERMPPRQAIEMAAFDGHSIPNLKFVVHVSTTALDVPLTPIDTSMARAGPSYAADVLALRTSGNTLALVYMFDSDMKYVTEWPRNDTPAPAHVFIPDLMRPLYAQHINMPPSMFVFRSCAAEAAPAPAAASTP